MAEPLAVTDFELICNTLGAKNPNCALAFMDTIGSRLRPIEERSLDGTRFSFLLSDVRPSCASVNVPEHDLYLQVFTIESHTGKNHGTNTLYTFDLTQGRVFDFSHYIQKLN